MPESSSAAQQRARPFHSQPRSSLLGNVVGIHGNDDAEQSRAKKHSASFECNQCSRRFTSVYFLRRHQQIVHEVERPFACTVCSEAFARHNDCKRHESLHRKPMEFSCRGTLRDGEFWGCGLYFLDVIALARHINATRACIMPLLEQEANHPEGLRRLQRCRDQWSVENLPTRLLDQYPALCGVDSGALSAFPSASKKVESRRSNLDAFDDHLLSSDEIGPDLGKVGADTASREHVGHIRGTQQHISKQKFAPHQPNLGLDYMSVDDSGYGSLDISTSTSSSSYQSLDPPPFAGDVPNTIPNGSEGNLLNFDRTSPLKPDNLLSGGVPYELFIFDWDAFLLGNDVEVRKELNGDAGLDIVSSSTSAISHEASASSDIVRTLHGSKDTTSLSCDELQESCTPRANDHFRDVEEPSAGQSLCGEKRAATNTVNHYMYQSLERAEMSSSSREPATIYDEARSALEELRLGIEDLSDGSETALETSESDFETPHEVIYSPHADTGRSNSGFIEDSGENAGVDQEQGSQSGATFETSQESGTSRSPNDQSNNKRSRPNDTIDDPTRADIGSIAKRTKLSCNRFICCFHDGPGRKCSGTDDTISEVIKKLSEQHDTHICDRCWQLKVKDETSGLPVHPNDESPCLDYCLSPQCLKTAPSIGHRHLFDTEICKRKTSRVRPGDSEAVFRFIFKMVQPELEIPAEITTDEHQLHLDAKPRQGRRKLTREELSARADELEEKLNQGKSQNVALNERVLELEKAFATSQDALREEEKKSLDLEQRMKRVVGILKDALRTGIFMDDLGHESLLERVGDDAPDALKFRCRSLLTPPGSIESQKSALTPASNGPDAVGPARMREQPVKSLGGNNPSDIAAKFDVLNNKAPAHCDPELGISDQELHDLFGATFATSNSDGTSTHTTPYESHNLDLGPNSRLALGVQKA